MEKIKLVLKVAVVLIMLALFARGVMYVAGGNSATQVKKDAIAIVSLNGVIVDAEKMIATFKDLESKDNIKGYVLRINSPGGLVVPSQELYEYLLTLKKPMYISMGSVAASGGYMVALAGNKIYAMPSTITGSIGVIMQTPNFTGLQEKIGISYKVIKSGKFKDAGSVNRPMTEEEEELLTDVIMDMYNQFIQVVSARRGMDIEQVKKYADGRIMTGRNAKELGFVDNTGSWRDAFTDLKNKLEMPGLDYWEVEESKPWWEKIGAKTGFLNALPEAGIYYIAEF